VGEPASGSMVRTAFIGLGSMGGALARRAVAAGHTCTIYDIDPAKRASFSSQARVADSLSDAVVDAAIVVACLVTADQYEEVLFGAGGLASARHPLTYVHAGTSSVPKARDWAKRLAPSDIAFVDAPVTGGPARAEAGDLVVMASGAQDAFARAEPLLNSYARKVIYLGETPGSAQMMKLTNNMLNFSNLAAAAEILVIGTKAGLDPEKMLEVINEGSGQNSATLAKFPQHILTGTFDYRGWISHVLKDGKAFLDEAADMTVPAPLSAAVYQAFVEAFAAGDERDDYDITEVIRHMEKAAGVEVRRR